MLSFSPRRLDLRLAVVASLVWVIHIFFTLAAGTGRLPPETPQSFAPEWWLQAFDHVVRGLPGPGGELLPGLTVGDTSAVSEPLTDAMRTSSLTHLTAVSGANCAVVTASVMALGGLIGLPLWARTVFGSLALVGFVVVVGLQPSVLRAAAMAIVVIVASSVGRPSAGIPVLSLAVIVLLLIFPAWSLAPGFMLSVVATASLIVLAPRLVERWTPRLGQRWATVVAVPVAAQLACQPIIVALSPRWPTYGIPANMMAEPAAPLATVLGMICFVLAPVVPALATGIGWVAWLPASWIGAVAHTASSLPFASLPWLSGGWGVVTSAACSVALGVLLLARRQRLRALSLAVVVGTLGLSLTVTVGMSVVSAATRPTEWVIAACDVGQGDGLIVRGLDASGRAHYLMIDTGRHEVPARSCLNTLGVNHLDLLVLTHFDLDHAGGVEGTYGLVDHALISAPQRPGDEWVVRDMAAHGIDVRRAQAGQHFEVGDVTCRVLWPAPGHPDMQGGNPGSIAISVQAPTLTATFLADLGRDAQDALLAQYPRLSHTDVLKVAHHGSADQSVALTERLSPTIAIVSVGKDNGYGHPTRYALDLLERMGTLVERTDVQGMILVSTTGGTIRVWSERAV